MTMAVLSQDRTIYDRLMRTWSRMAADDRHVLASVIALALAEGERPLTEALGLDGATLARVLDTAFPGAFGVGEPADLQAGGGEDAIEEPDYRQLLLDGRRSGGEIEEWMARIVARRSLKPEHLWISLGLRHRQELSDMLHRHFPVVAGRNVRGMRWKKFFYREMCQAEGVFVCKSPVCDVCPDFSHCYGAEE